MTEQWRGPFALAVYIPAPAGSTTARVCRARVIEYLQQFTLRHVPAYAVALLYANGGVPNLHCDVSAQNTGFETPYAEHKTFRSRFEGRPWTSVWQAEYPVNELRTLARGMVRLPASCATVLTPQLQIRWRSASLERRTQRLRLV